MNKVVGFTYNKGDKTSNYIYRRNLQGDIIGVYDSLGNEVGGYAYDAYEKCYVKYKNNSSEEEKAILNTNPFRYRGYYYDNETGLYYLNARYYDPSIGRFISPDVLTILDETKGQINGLNLYMYCNNNPIMYVDPSGFSFWSVFKKIAGIVMMAVAIAVAVVITVVAIIALAPIISPLLAIGAGILIGASAFGLTMIADAKLMNIITYIDTETYVNKNSNLDYSDYMDEFESIYSDGNASTYGWSREKKMMYILYLKQEHSDDFNNWTLGEMLREYEYHDRAFSVLRYVSDPNSPGSLAYRTNHVDFEYNQTFKTYIYRLIGNFLFW